MNLDNLILVVCLVIVQGEGTKKKKELLKVKQWWQDNSNYGNKITHLVFEKDRNQIIKPIPQDDNGQYEPEDVMISLSTPKTTEERLKNVILEHFSHTRHREENKEEFRKVKNTLKTYLSGLGLEIAEQTFWPPEMEEEVKDVSNLIAVWPSDRRQMPGDEILLITAHYDTRWNTPGVDDNGSGSGAVVEIARLIAEHRCKLNMTLMFVLFDMEEEGLKGSKHFIQDYLIPIEVQEKEAKVLGNYNLDMILQYDPREGSQVLEDTEWVSQLPDWVDEMNRTGAHGDFVAVWARKGFDTMLFDALDRNWLNPDKYKLSLMAAPLPELAKDVDKRLDVLYEYYTIASSDHASFWYPTVRNLTFPAVMLHDMAPWRVETQWDFHTPSDSVDRGLTDENLSYAKNTVDSLIKTIIDLTNGKCF